MMYISKLTQDIASLLVDDQSIDSQELNTVAHSDIFDELLEQFKPLDFVAIVHPIKAKELRDKVDQHGPESLEGQKAQKELNMLRVGTKHYLVISIEEVLRVAKQNNWGLCKRHDFIYLYNGAYWTIVEDDRFEDFLGKAAERMGVDKYNARLFSFRKDLYKQFQASALLSPPRATKETVRINLKNGTFEVNPRTNNRLAPFDPKHFLTYQLPFEHAPKATAPVFQAYLDKVLPDTDKARQKVLAEYLGFVFIKHGSEAIKIEKSLILFGTGANGKSVFFEIVNALLGKQNVSSYSLQSLTDSNGYTRAKIADKLVNYASEINGKLETSIFKQLVSGEPVEARLPYGEPFNLDDYAKLIFNCNDLPKDVEHTNAYFRRFLIIPFDVTIPKEQQDRQLHHKIINSELSGVFNWVLEGLNRLLKQGQFTHCQAIEDMVEAYKKESDSVQLFMEEEGYEKHSDDYVLLKKFYDDYRRFCLDDGYIPLNKKNCKKRLETLGVEISRKSDGNRVYLQSESLRKEKRESEQAQKKVQQVNIQAEATQREEERRAKEAQQGENGVSTMMLEELDDLLNSFPIEN